MPFPASRLSLVALCAALAICALPTRGLALSSQVPSWLQKHVGYSDGQIAPVVLKRARTLYLEKRKRGQVRNPCYFAMDATRPSTDRNGAPGQRFYIICEDKKSFRAVSSGYGNGRNLRRASFSNGRQCARHFSNTEGSKLTMGGTYMTAEHRTSFKGYYRQNGQIKPFYRTFLPFDGQGETRNSRERAIGGHQAMFLKWQCRMKKPGSPHADKDGYVPFGRLVNYVGGRSNGCTTWSGVVSRDIIAMTKGRPTTLYIYPESRDIQAVAKAVSSGRSPASTGHYWNSACLSAIGAPRFWPKRDLQPIINQWRQSLPKQPPLVLPICQ
ncbi:MAG: hypothetical protein AAF686_05150 [Pseudomonadota bacterium]